MKRCALLVLLTTLCLAWSVDAASRRTKTFTVNHRDPAALLVIVKGMLTESGSAVLDNATGALVVSDTPEVLRSVESYLKENDRILPKVQIEVWEVGAFEMENLQVDSELVTSDGRWKATVIDTDEQGRPIAGNHSKIIHFSSRAGQASRLVESGSPAFVETAPKMAASSAGMEFIEKLGYRTQIGGATFVQAGLQITPTVIGTAVRLSIVPSVTVYNDKGAKNFPLQQGALTVKLEQDKLLVVGSDIRDGASVPQETFFGFAGRTGGNTFRMIRVRIDQPGETKQ